MLKVISQSEVRTASDGRKYTIVEFADAKNPFVGKRSENNWQQFTAKSDDSLSRNDMNPKWKVEPSQITDLIKFKTEIPGSIVTREVVPYDVNGRTVNTYTCVVFEHENVATKFKSLGHPLVKEEETLEVVSLGTEKVLEAEMA